MKSRISRRDVAWENAYDARTPVDNHRNFEE